VTVPPRGSADTVRAYLDALNRGSADEAAACVAEDFVNEHTAALGRSLTGRRVYRERLGEFLDGFPGLHYAIERLIVDGDEVAVAYRLTAGWRAAPGAEARPFTIRGMFRFEVRGGLIAHRVDYWDSAEFQRQVQPPQSPESQPKR
jgi:steroid delta-isomerase-like uncharacterized protein